MNFPVHSLRWRLQLWYGCLLILVLSGFGITAYQLERGRQFRRIDGELNRRLSALAGTLRPPGRREGEPHGERPGPPHGERPEPPRGPPSGNGADFFPRGGPPEFHLPPFFNALFPEDATNGYYYTVWSRDGQVLSASSQAPTNLTQVDFEEAGAVPVARLRAAYREVYLRTPPGNRLLVGRTVSPELGELRRTAWALTGVGAVVLSLGMAGGWWLASRAIRPITTIGTTAAKIAAGDLSQRIGATETDDELGRLAHVLNSTFARLEAAFNQQARFTADAAHELRTPLAVLLTQSQTALARERSAPEYREALQTCLRAAQRMRRLIEHLLELARLDAGQEKMKHLSMDLGRVAAECVELVRPLAQERGLILETEFALLPCSGDPERLSQVITNLLTNAIHYNREAGLIRVTAQARDGAAVVSVTDTGHGIGPSDLPHIFERFYRADPTRSGTSGRNGLGLAIAKAIVEAHGGTLQVTSELDQGSCFTIVLPLS